ncbi:glycosyltransferase family 9 protein, partial [Candidatus Margulisiibacteriota bacterium]
HKLIGIHLGVGAGNKALEPKKFAEYINLLQEKINCEVCITGYSEKEKKYRDEFVSEVKGRIIDLVGKTTIMELIGVFAVYDLYVGVDTGPFHLAASLGVPQLAIFPTRKVKPTRWAPWRNRHFIIRKSNSCPHFCPHEGCKLTICSDEIEIQEMIEKTISLLEGKGVSKAQEQFFHWFCYSMQILILYNKKTQVEALEYKEKLSELGFTAYARNICERKLYRYLLEKDINIIHNFTSRKKFKLFWTSLFVSLKLFNPPLIINKANRPVNKEQIIAFYKNKFGQKKL